MTAITVHYRGKGTEQRDFPALPRAGDLLDADGLWRVEMVVFGASVDVYAVRLADNLAAETRREWSAWGEAVVIADAATDEQKGFFV